MYIKTHILNHFKANMVANRSAVVKRNGNMAYKVIQPYREAAGTMAWGNRFPATLSLKSLRQHLNYVSLLAIESQGGRSVWENKLHTSASVQRVCVKGKQSIFWQVFLDSALILETNWSRNVNHVRIETSGEYIIRLIRSYCLSLGFYALLFNCLEVPLLGGCKYIVIMLMTFF